MPAEQRQGEAAAAASGPGDGAQPPPQRRRHSALQATLAGAISGAVTRATLSPLDVIKIRLQLQLEPVSHTKVATWGHSSKYKGILHCLRVIVREEGVRGLWKGHVIGQMLSVSYCSVQFPVYQTLLRKLRAEFPAHKDSAMLNGLAGGMAAATASFAVYPFDILRTRFSAQGQKMHYQSLPHAVSDMFREGGIRAFYKGLAPTLLNISPSAALQFGYYNLFKSLSDSLVNHKSLRPFDSHLESASVVLSHLGAGTLAGVLSKLTLLPLETVKKRLQVQGFEVARQEFGRTVAYSGMLHCIALIYKLEGLRGFFKGGAISLLKSAAVTAVTFVVYDFVLDTLPSLIPDDDDSK
eukprot:m.86622 g.86622  ORF g.86622 m.86622 type:complete len:353 (-) comp15101_c0_seq2:488-1546(-)